MNIKTKSLILSLLAGCAFAVSLLIGLGGASATTVVADTHWATDTDTASAEADASTAPEDTHW